MKIQDLRQLNFRAAIFHYIILIGIFIWFWIKLKPNYQNVKLVRLKANATDPLNYTIEAQPLYYQSIPFWVLTFFAITSFAHILYATDFWASGLYTKVVTEGWNPFRWVEYGITASIMFYILCLIDGIRDVAAIYPIVVSIAVVMGQGWVVENQLIMSKPDWRTVTAATLFGWVLLITAFIVLAYTLITTLIDINKVPVWVPLLTSVEFVSFSLFGIQQLKHINMVKNGTMDFMKIEKGYIYFSFIAKIFLGAVLCYGLLDYQAQSS